MARPTKYDPIKGETICGLLAAGNFLSDAAALVGVDPRTVERWIERGEQEGREPYKTFAGKVAKARAQFAAQGIQLLRTSDSLVKAKSMQWLLGHLRPRQFGDRVQVHVTQELERILDRLREAFADEPKLYERILAVITGEPGSPTAAENTGEALPRASS